MRIFCFFLLALMPLSALGQIAPVHTQCPVAATQITPRAFFARIHSAVEDGWRPGSKMTLDVRIKNKSDRDISAWSFRVEFPANQLLDRDLDRIPTMITAGGEGTIHYDGLINLEGTPASLSVILSRIKFADGEIYDCSCPLGSVRIPPMIKPVKPVSPSQVTPPGDELSPPRVLESQPLDAGAAGKASKSKTVTLSLVVEVDGSTRDMKVESGSLGAELDKKAIETLGKWIFTPAMVGDKPVAAKTTVQLTIGH